jgi:hypothetical protein
MIMKGTKTNIIKVIKQRSMEWIGHIARMEETKTAYGVLVWKPHRKTSFQRPRGRRDDNIKKGVFRKLDVKAGAEFICLRIGASGELL